MQIKRRLGCISLVLIMALTLLSPALTATKGTSLSILPVYENNSWYLSADFPLIYDIITQVNESRLEEHIQVIQGFGPHPTGSDALEHLKVYLFNEFTNAGLTVRLDPWRYKLRHGENIEATLTGQGSAGNWVLISAHYDSISISPGADDDGSGVATILTIAEIMSQYRFNSTVKFVLFSGEEQGLLGSHEYAQNAQKQQENIIGVLNLDGVGYADSIENGRKVWDFADDNAAWMVKICRKIAEMYSNEIDLQVASRPNIPISDHQSFVEHGFVTNCLLEGTINPFYHTSEDTIDHMNLSYLTKVCRLAAGTIATMAEVNRVLTNDDIIIQVKGTIRSNPNLFKVRVENKRYLKDTANLSVHVEIQNSATGEYLRQPYNTSTNWTTLEEVGEYWEFIVGPQIFPSQRIQFTVTIEGLNDDIGLYKQVTKTGFMCRWFLLLRPFSH